MEDSLPFPIETLRTAQATLPQKRVSITSSDSGVNSPHVLSPAMPITPDNSQPYLVPSTPRMNPPTGPLTPNPQFFNNLAASNKTTSLKIIVPSPIILIYSLCFVPALDKAINFKFPFI